MTSSAARFDTLAEMIGFQLPRAAAAAKVGLEAELQPFGLRTSEATLLLYVGDNPGRTQSEIGRDLRVKPANMTPLVGRMADAGLVEKVAGKGRAVGLQLTAAGAGQLKEVRRALQRQEDRITALMTPDEKALVLRVMRAIVQAELCGREA